MNDILYLFMVLLVVAAVLYLSFRFSKFISKQSGKLGGGASHMKVFDRLAVGNDRYLLIVELQGKFYLMSSCGQSVEILKELEDFVPPPEPEEGERKTFSESFKTVLQDYTNRNRRN